MYILISAMDIEELTSTIRMFDHKEEQQDEAVALQEYSTSLQAQEKFYDTENARMEANLIKLKVAPHQLKLECQSVLTKLTNLQEKYKSNKCSVLAISLSYADQLCEGQNHYLTKVKSSIKMYNIFIDKITKKIKVVKSETREVNKDIASLESTKDVATLKMKIESYKTRLLKLEKKYPWIQDPKFNVENIKKELDRLNTLRREESNLTKELDVYQNLKPDINEATKQLEQIKVKYSNSKKGP